MRLSLRGGATQYAHGIALALLACALLTRFFWVDPGFPADTGLSASWKLGLLAGTGAGMNFGTDLVFTFGPYAAVYVGQFSDATRWTFLIAGFLLISAFWLALRALTRVSAMRWRWVWIGVLVLIARPGDALFLLYPLLLVATVAAQESEVATDHTPPLGAARQSWLLTPLGLLPLIKGTFLLFVGACIPLLVALHLRRRQYRLAMLDFLVPAASLLLLWTISGQPLSAMPAFFSSLLAIVSGYTNAMSTRGPLYEIAAFLATSAVILIAVGTRQRTTATDNGVLFIAFVLYLFVAFKGGFVRHDGHALSAADAALLAAVVASTAGARTKTVVLICGLACWLLIGIGHRGGGAIALGQKLADAGVGTLAAGHRATSAASLADLAPARRAGVPVAETCRLPALDGTIDVYSYGQACVVLNGLKWDPRPVFQSYSAYTPALATMNADHLRSPNAPDHVLLRIEPIDHRLAALEDGNSWPSLIDDYEIAGFDHAMLHLVRRPMVPPAPEPSLDNAAMPIHVRLGTDLALPQSSEPVLSSIDLKPTALGRLVALLYKLPPVFIETSLANGAQTRHRFIPEMAIAPIILSPAVENTRDFALLHAHEPNFLADRRVTRMRLSTDRLGELLWQSEFSVRWMPEAASTRHSTNLPVGIREAIFAKAIVLHDRPITRQSCVASIDKINGIDPAPTALQADRLLDLSGWLTLSTQKGTVGQAFYTLLRPQSGAPILFEMQREPRPDVANHFQHPGLSDSGYSALIDTSGLEGVYALSLAQTDRDGALIECEDQRQVTIKHAN